ncbi:uncharacterized protein LOC130553458 isoform X2 [Triplophysa rosa]|uniref:uncharacterized protein LOC130553458 isoform X2 n=1 Tax=Triplophysa rosa TaxID=992332 RepID=UPI002545C41A|nr:uncharacterized protein LOC130553458 isoform X2 [Triplophysa rosa]XP_057188415.1 uncharacterized protein LOC130553458 isoform X2 [Triplophysa rosa]
MGAALPKPVQPAAPTYNPEFDKPWRDFKWDQKSELKKHLEEFSLSNPDVKHIRILVAGPIGAGKSSFINSVNNVFQGLITSEAPANSSSSHGESFTTTAIPQVIVMTKVDEACPLVNKDLKKIYYSKKIKEKMQICHDKLGVLMCNIFPVKNYHEEIDTNDKVDVLILKALDQIVRLADDRLFNSSGTLLN